MKFAAAVVVDLFSCRACVIWKCEMLAFRSIQQFVCFLFKRRVRPIIIRYIIYITSTTVSFVIVNIYQRPCTFVLPMTGKTRRVIATSSRQFFIGMESHDQGTIGLFDLFFGGSGRYLEYFVVGWWIVSCGVCVRCHGSFVLDSSGSSYAHSGAGEIIIRSTRRSGIFGD